MFKLALAAAIAAEWLHGPVADSPASLGSATLRALMLSLAIWAALEAVRLLWRAVLSLDPNR